ncbi:MAG: hypothetical protein EOO96_17380 [Pedobacter sp.]|nr:MAG: hypothetical protein EOO96_17380 [Pedobacter sp.]
MILRSNKQFVFGAEVRCWYKKVMKHWIMSAKQEQTRLSRLQKTIEISEQLKRMA